MAAKRDPHLISYCRRPPPPRLKSRPLQIGFYITEAVRYEQLIFHSLFLLFLFFRSFSLSFFDFCVPFFRSCRSWSLFLRFFSPFLPNAHTQNLPFFSPLSRSVWLGDLCFSHLPAWLNPPVCVAEPNAVLRMITICPPPLVVALNLNSSSSFCFVLPVSCLLKWSDWPYLPNNSTLNGKGQCQLEVGVCIGIFNIWHCVTLLDPYVQTLHRSRRVGGSVFEKVHVSCQHVCVDSSLCCWLYKRSMRLLLGPQPSYFSWLLKWTVCRIPFLNLHHCELPSANLHLTRHAE